MRLLAVWPYRHLARDHGDPFNADLSSEALATEIGIHRTTLSLIERGHGNPTWEVLGTIADGIVVEVIEIVGLAGQLPAKRPPKKRS